MSEVMNVGVMNVGQSVLTLRTFRGSIADCDNWQTGKKEIWTQEWALGLCKTKFRGSRIASLEFKIVLEPFGLNSWTDELRLCNLTVHFVEPSMTWRWDGATDGAAETTGCIACKGTDSPWYNMTFSH